MGEIYRFSKSIMSFINDKLAEICGFLLFAIMILLTVNVASREFGIAIPGLTTTAVLILIAVVYLGQSRTEEHDEHANVDMVTNMLPSKWKTLNSLFINILKLFTISFFFYGSIGSFISSYQANEIFADVVKIPMWPAKLAIVIGLFFFAIQILLKLIEDIRILSKKSWKTNK
ncbi:TRAP transporter small permease [Virgibacillus byunsanensis]|uniref:TRAP transporter small permease n=1 Tax=Virgibacillus byunsanensis TaxID=570945 RepID=A0ABW3LPE0_9BACI